MIYVSGSDLSASSAVIGGTLLGIKWGWMIATRLSCGSDVEISIRPTSYGFSEPEKAPSGLREFVHPGFLGSRVLQLRLRRFVQYSQMKFLVL